VRKKSEEEMEGVMISGVALDTDEAKVTIVEVPDHPGVAARLFKAIAAEGINVDMIVQNVSHESRTDMSFTAPRADLARLEGALGSLTNEIGADRFTIDDDIAKVSLVGAGMKSHPGVAADMFDVLATEGINIEMISTSPIRVSCVIRRADGDRALAAVHERFGLGE
jgi:aspartate kinase